MIGELKGTFLVQRLEQFSGEVERMSNTGLNTGTKRLFEGVCSFDLMACSDFECGSVQKTFDRIVEYCIVDGGAKGNVQLAQDVMYLCRKGYEDQVADRIIQLASNEEGNFRLRRPAYFEANIRGNENHATYPGWLEMNNDFMFFTDEEMARKFYSIFGLK